MKAPHALKRDEGRANTCRRKRDRTAFRAEGTAKANCRPPTRQRREAVPPTSQRRPSYAAAKKRVDKTNGTADTRRPGKYTVDKAGEANRVTASD
ncbi:hypothetical protein MRX96_022786 [Rhipicephalus microplus]